MTTIGRPPPSLRTRSSRVARPLARSRACFLLRPSSRISPFTYCVCALSLQASSLTLKFGVSWPGMARQAGVLRTTRLAMWSRGQNGSRICVSSPSSSPVAGRPATRWAAVTARPHAGEATLPASRRRRLLPQAPAQRRVLRAAVLGEVARQRDLRAAHEHAAVAELRDRRAAVQRLASRGSRRRGGGVSAGGAVAGSAWPRLAAQLGELLVGALVALDQLVAQQPPAGLERLGLAQQLGDGVLLGRALRGGRLRRGAPARRAPRRRPTSAAARRGRLGRGELRLVHRHVDELAEAPLDPGQRRQQRLHLLGVGVALARLDGRLLGVQRPAAAVAVGDQPAPRAVGLVVLPVDLAHQAAETQPAPAGVGGRAAVALARRGCGCASAGALQRAGDGLHGLRPGDAVDGQPVVALEVLDGALDVLVDPRGGLRQVRLAGGRRLHAREPAREHADALARVASAHRGAARRAGDGPPPCPPMIASHLRALTMRSRL